jgi:hypothetical protein
VAGISGFAERASATAGAGALYLLVAPRLDAPVRRMLREAGVSYADLAGSLFLSAPGIAVRVDAPADRSAPTRGPERGEVSPFADKASLVLRAMLREPARTWGVRELAGTLGISPGLVSRTGEVLVSRGYAEPRGGKLVLRDAAAALIDWASAGQWRRNRMRSFVVPYAGEELRQAAWNVVESYGAGLGAMTQLAALDAYASNVAGTDQVHAYCGPDVFESVAVGVTARLHGEAVQKGGNLHIVRPSLHNSVLFDAREVEGVRVVSPVQLFIDLCGYPVRGGEGAEMLLRSVLAPEVGLNAQQVRQISGFLEAL